MIARNRRGVLRAGAFALFAVLVVTRPWDRWLSYEIEFEPLAGLPPFRTLGGVGALSGGGLGDPMLIGLPDPSQSRDEMDLVSELRPTLCTRVLGSWTVGGPVPVTYFTDLRCMNCVAIERHLDTITAETPDAIHLMKREFPVFGPISELAARGILAAGQQGAAEALRARLKRSAPPAGAAGLAVHAEALGLDVARFHHDVDGAEVADRLAEDRAMARIFGAPGTPTLIIGRTRVIGLQSLDLLRAIVAREVAEGPPECF